MANGLGEYFGPQAQQQAAQAGAPQLDPRPTRNSVLAPPAGLPQTSGMGEYFSQNGMGAWNLGPVAHRRPGAFRKIATKVSPLAGALGDVSDVLTDAKSGMVTGLAAATTVTTTLLGMGLRFGAGWIVGKALAPNRSDEKAYMWGGAIASTVFGSIGLGVTALVAQNTKK